MSKSSRSNGPTLNRRELLRLSTAAGVGTVMPTSRAFAATEDGPAAVGAGTCSTPRSAVATTQYGKVRGYVEDGVLIGGCRRRLPLRGTASTRR
jgi:para-nitrobenzyl esterase